MHFFLNLPNSDDPHVCLELRIAWERAHLVSLDQVQGIVHELGFQPVSKGPGNLHTADLQREDGNLKQVSELPVDGQRPQAVALTSDAGTCLTQGALCFVMPEDLHMSLRAQ